MINLLHGMSERIFINKEYNMTLQGLINRLEKLKKTAGPRAKVVVDLAEFLSICKDYSHWEICMLTHEIIRFEVEGSFENKDGSEKLRSVITLS